MTVDMNSVYIHSNGNFYSPIVIANSNSTNDKYVETIVYRNVDNNTVWSRPLNDWERSFTLHGSYCQKTPSGGWGTMKCGKLIESGSCCDCDEQITY